MVDAVQDGNTEFAKADFKEQIQLAETSFKTVLDSDLHEDDKAGRILSAMAFLTAAAAGIFSVAYTPGPSTTTLKQTLTQTLLPYISTAQIPSAVNSAVESLQKPSLTIFGLSAPVLAFSAYIFFVLVGTALYLGALGPNFNRPSWFQGRRQGVHSLLFFKNIGVLDKEAWSNYWLNDKRTLAQLQAQLVKNYIDECWLIAQKEDAKVTLMSLGSLSFRIAVLFLVILMATLFLPDSGVVGIYLLLGLFGIFASFLFVNLTQPPQKLQLPRKNLLQQAVQSEQQSDNQQAVRPEQQADKKKVPWQSLFLIALTGLSLLGFLVLLFLRLIGLIV